MKTNRIKLWKKAWKRDHTNSIKCCDISQIIPTCSFMHLPPPSFLWMYCNEIGWSDLCSSSPNRESGEEAKLPGQCHMMSQTFPLLYGRGSNWEEWEIQFRRTWHLSLRWGFLVKHTWGIRRQGVNDHIFIDLFSETTSLFQFYIYRKTKRIGMEEAGIMLEEEAITDKNGWLLFYAIISNSNDQKEVQAGIKGVC